MGQYYTVNVVYGVKLSPEQVDEIEEELGLFLSEWGEENDFDVLVDSYGEGIPTYLGKILKSFEYPEEIGFAPENEYSFDDLRTRLFGIIQGYSEMSTIEINDLKLYVVARIE